MSDHRVILADCLGPKGLATLADKSVDHVITDPPYAKVVVNTAKGAPALSKGKGLVARRDLGYAGISDEQRVLVAAHIARVARRWALVFCDAESLTAWRDALEAGGMRHIRMGSWVSPACTPQFTGDRPGTGWEACEISHAPGKCAWNGGGRPAVWIVNRPLNGSQERESNGHPTPKPLELMERIVADFTDPGDIILDCFAGSGTTGVACKRLGRRFIGFERDAKYHAIAQKRIDGTREQLDLLRERGPKPVQASLLPAASLTGEG